MAPGPANRQMLNCPQPDGPVRHPLVRTCSQRWSELNVTADPRLRVCTACRADVHLVANVVEARIRAQQGECIAVPPVVSAVVRKNVGARLPDGVVSIGYFDEVAFLRDVLIDPVGGDVASESTQSPRDELAGREYVGIVWRGDEVGIRFSLTARDAVEAGEEARRRYGPDAVYTLWNEEDANRPR